MKKPSVLTAALVFLVLAIVAVVGGVALAVDDALWFIPVFRADAAYIDLYWDGEQMRLEPGSPGYALLNQALHKDLPHVTSYPKGAGLSDDTLEHLRAEGRLVEAHYAEPVRVHSRYYFGSSQVLYIPLSDYHAAHNRVFNAGRGVPLELRSIDTIMTAAETVAQQ